MIRDIFWDEMKRMQESMDRLFEDMKSHIVAPQLGNNKETKAVAKTMVMPQANYKEDEKKIYLSVQVPGFDKKDVKVRMDEHGIEIKAQTCKELQRKNKDASFMHSSFNGFYRKVPLPSYADTTKAEAVCENGLLKITVPKKKEAIGKRKELPIK